MSHRNSHLPRRELYAYRFKEGGNDRRELEAALWEIDQLERQTEFEYNRPSPSHPWTSGSSPFWCPPYSSGSPSNARYHDVHVTRTNSDLYPELGMRSLSSQSYAECNDNSTSFDGYQRGYAHRTYPSHAVPSAFPGYPNSQSSMTSRDYQSSHYVPPSRPLNSNYQDFHDSIGISQASHHQNHRFEPSMAHSRTSYGPSHHSQYPLQQALARGTSTPWQLQMVTRRSGRNESPNPERAVDPRQASATPAPQMMSPHWSMVATEGTARSESSSVTSSRGMYDGQNVRDMGYIGTASPSSESFSYSNSDEEYISDGTDEAGYYYSSDSDLEEYWENDEEFSEGSDDFYEDDGFSS